MYPSGQFGYTGNPMQGMGGMGQWNTPGPLDTSAALMRQVRYTRPDRVLNDLRDLFFQFQPQGVEISTIPFESRPVLTLSLLLPIHYKGATYNMPVKIWVTENYPVDPVVVYLNPATNMIVVPSQDVQDNGRVLIPYVRNWSIPSMGGSMVGAPPPPYPSGSVVPPPAYGFNSPPTPAYPGGSASGVSASTGYGSNYGASGQYSGYGQSMSGSMVGGPTGPGGNPLEGSTGYGAHYGSPSTSMNSYPKPYQPPNPVSSPPGYTSSPPSYPGQNRQAPPPAYSPQPLQPTYTPPEDPKLAELNAKQKLSSKVSAAVQELHRSVNTDLDKATMEAVSLDETRGLLEDSKNTVLREIEQTENQLAILTREIKDIQEWIDVNDRHEEVNVDDITDPRDPLQKQMLNLRAEDACIEDVQYYLDKAILAGRLDLATYLKMTRHLSSEQFYKRALMLKLTELGAR